MPFIISLENHENVLVQGRAVVKQREGKVPPLISIETSGSMVQALGELFRDQSILSVGRLTELVPGRNEVVWESVKGTQEQISEFSFDRDRGIGVNEIILIASVVNS